MRVILHAGMNKTGSTSIQQYLAANRGRLRETGMLYPDLGYADHWPLIPAISPTEVKGYLARRQTQDAGRDATEGAIERFKAEIAAARDCDTLILSHEGFSFPPNSTSLTAFLQPIVGDDAEMRSIAYARSPIDLFPSVIQQKLKSRDGREMRPSSWISDHPKRGAHLREVFGDGLTLRAYSRRTLLDEDVLADFRQWVIDQTGRATPPPSGNPEANVALSAQACALIQLWKVDFGPEANDRDFIQMRKLVTAAPLPGTPDKLIMPDGWRASIASLNHERWNGLVDMMDHADEIRERLKIPQPDADARLRRVKSRDWVLSYLDVGFVTSVIRFNRRQQARDSTSRAALMDWLISVRRRLNQGTLGPARPASD